MKVEYKRKYFIKDLFNAKTILDNFDYITFESINAFVKAMKLDLIRLSKVKWININMDNMEDYEIFKQVITESSLCEQVILWLEIKDQKIYDEIIVDLIPMKYDIVLSSEIEANISEAWKIENTKEWIRNNRIIKRITLRGDNFRDIICDVINTYNNEFIRFFMFDVIYKSFEDIKIKDLKHIRHWCFRLLSYTIKDNQNKSPPLSFVRQQQFVKTIFVSNDLKLYLDSKKNPIWCIDLLENMDKSGEDIDFKELNWWRTYIDLDIKAMAIEFKVWNWFLIDFTQNLEQRGQINEIPEIISLLTWWLNETK